MKKKYNLILLSQSVNLAQESFLKSEYAYLKEDFPNIYCQAAVENTKWNVEYQTTGYKESNSGRVKNLILKNWKLLLQAWVTEFIKSPKRFYYLSNAKKFFNIWAGWLQEAAAWEQALKPFNPEDTIIYTYWYENQAMPLTILLAQNKLPFKWVSRAHGYDVDKRQRNDGVIPFRHWMLKHQPNALVSISEFGKGIFKKDYKADVHVQRLGTKDLGIAASPSASDPLRVISISNLIPLKRVHLIIKCLEKCKVPITWTHYGDGPLANELQWESLPKNIKVIRKGQIDHAQLLQELQETPFDLMIHLSELEGIPVSIMECMSLGIPAMACDTGGVSEIVDNECGWLLPVDFDIMQVSMVLDEIAADKEIAGQKRALARAKWEKDYQADVNFTEFIHSFLINSKK